MDTLIPVTARKKLRPESTPHRLLFSEKEYVGFILLTVSFLTFVWKDFQAADSSEEYMLMIFFIHYVIALFYAGYLIWHKALGVVRSRRPENIHNNVILLNLFFISAYALNRVVEIFQDSTSWLCALILVTSFTGLSYRFFECLPRWVNRIQHLMLGLALVFYGYLAFFVANYYIFGFIGILALGIGAHIFVPAAMIAGHVFLLRQRVIRKRISFHWVTLGAIATVFFGVAFVVEWSLRVVKIETLANQSVIFQDTRLPIWITIGQDIRNDWISQRILKSDLVYTTAPEKFGEWQFFPRANDWSETKKHDPLVFLASMKAKSTLSREDRIKILKAISNARHQAEERLWTGEHLTTSYIVSDVDMYPELRIAYTEKYFNVRNNDISQARWRTSEEAMYTFQLPEGSVVSSLSLWVNGKEEKGILTSKQKAANAYRSIVGVERRDPSVVHWQEGNTITVRVFPCTNAEERKFKIGVTSPLEYKNGDTVYKNISFYGPDATNAKETTRIRIIGPSQNIQVPGKFIKTPQGEFLSEHTYDPNFEISFPAVPLVPSKFSFDGASYTLHEYKPEFQTANFENIYLDLNNTWTNKELAAVQSMVQDFKVYVYTQGEFVQVLPENWKAITRELTQRNFSLFPFHLIGDPASVLVISKGDIFTPHLSDFKESGFAEEISRYFNDGKKVKVFNLEGGISTYINSLRELRALKVHKGSIGELKDLLSKRQFLQVAEDESTITLSDAGFSITKTMGSGRDIPNTAPDHLMRLFVYNDIMRQVGGDYFNDDYINENLVRMASTAYVVSPVSSLIVLETQDDYDRFEIRDEGNSLFNATKQSSGAVPEPHEWALILLFVLFVIYVRLRN